MEEAGGMEDHYEAMHETRGPQSKSYPRVVLTGLALFGTACGSLFYMAYDTTPFLEDSMDVVDPNATVSADGLSQCSRFTDGTCRLLPCHSWRGKTQCVGGLLHGTCECMPGYCVNDWGVCVPPPGTCPKDTGGTCRFFGCSSSRGPTDCVDGKCVCKEGTCADVHGFCDRPTAVPPCPSDTGHTCRFFGCAAELGDTECRYGKCLCKADQCGTLTGKCRPRGFCGKDTGGSCRHLSCYGSRGPTECIDGECRCQPGFCAENSGSGYGVCDIRKGQGTEFINYGKYNATVAPVNQEHREFPWPHNKVKTAVCISGGGARALTWALGAYRTLEALGLMRHVDAVSSVSGGTWASAIYMFARAPLEELLGAPAPPEAVTVEYIDRVPPALGAVVTTGYATFAKRNALSRMRAADAYVDYVGQTFLGPFGLGNATHFMAGSPEDVERIKRDNRELRHEAFLTPVPGRPKVFVMGGMIGPPVGFAAGPENAILIEMSPDYVGAPFWPNDGKVTYQPAPGSGVPPLTATIGGGLVEAFAFGGVAPRDQSGGTEVPLPSPLQPFSLAKAVGISSFGPSLDLSGRLGLTCAIPRGELWPVTSEHEGAKIHELGDAGNMENSGVVAMLQRGAEKIAMWVNTPVPLGTGYDFCAPNASDQPFRGEWIKDKVDVIFSALFGSGVDTVDDGYLGHNQVFPQEDLAPTLCALQELKKAGKPLVYKASFSVQPNEWWGILGGWSVEVVMVYADKSTEFESKLPAETQAALPKNYPYYDTGLYLTKRQVNILSAQSEYSIRTNEASFREVLCPRGLGGYCCRPERHCEICNSVFPDSREITGCRDWTPSYYCRRIYLQTLGKWGKDPTDSSFREAIRNYHVSQGSGEPGNWHSKHWRCSVWCDASAPYACEGQPRSVEDFRGVNYGGRFVPEKYLGLPGTDDLFHGVMQPKDVAGRHVGSVSLCDVGQQIANASQRVSNFLDVNIKPEHFSRIAAFGFNVVRLPLGYWNLVDLPGAAAPNGLTPERWRGLQGIMPASRYGEWIDRVFDYAGESGLRVLLDLHGAPGGQTGNAFTGCDTGKGHCNFDTAWNKQLAVQAVEKMAQLCRAHGRACYGIELLNEPAFGRSDLRPFLKDYYGEAMKAARRHLDKDVPLVIMDWTQMLPWWKEQKPFTYGEFGRVVFSTHMYDGFGVHGQHRSRQAFVEDLREIEDFFYGTKYEVIVSEYSLSGHGTGKPEEDSFDYHSLANWLVHQISQRSLGSAVWNYDAAGFSRIWGPVADENLGARPIRWKDIFELGLPGSAQELRASSVDARSSALRGEVRSAELRSAELEELRASSVDARSSALRGEARSAELRSAELEVLAAQQPAQGSTFQGLVALLPAPGFGLLALLAALAAGLVSLVAGRSLAREAPQASLQLRMNEEEGPAQGVETARGEQATLKNVRANGLYAAMPRETDCPDSVDGVIYNL